MLVMQSNDFLKVEIPDFLKMEPSSACSTPGPSPSPAPSGMSFSAPPMRRPSRKSTLTQQQKNQKRQRATQDQLTTLEIEFARNPTPAAVVRERIAQEINMTERSVQIWFQNRRAKIKNLAKKSIETGEDYEAIPESMRRYLAMQALESGKPYVSQEYFGAGPGAYSNGFMLNADASSKVMIYHLACRSLSIGSWKRIGQSQLDLVVFYSPTKAMITYYIQADGSGFRIEYPFSYIDSITLDNGDGTDSSKTGGLILKLNRPPIFTMDQGSGGWFQCRDFTEDQQASKVLTHHLGGHPKVLASQLAKLVSLETFQHRHNPMDFAAGMPGPEIISPTIMTPIHRPSSQPNHLVHPHHQQTAFPAFATDGAFSMGPPPARGHKRQRSRSVPVAVDFSQLRQPITPFVMHQHQHFHTHLNNNRTRMFAPVPRHAQQQIQHMSPLGPAIQVDPSAGYGMDMPALSTSGTSPPSDFDSSIMTGPASDNYLQTPFHSSFISTIPESATSAVDSIAETPISAHSAAGNNADHLLHLQTPCPLQRSASTSAIPQMLGGNQDQFPMNLKSSDFSADANMPMIAGDMFELNSDALLIQDEFTYDPFLSDPLADPFFDYSSMPITGTSADMFGDLAHMAAPTSAAPTSSSTLQGKRHCAKQSLTLPLRLNMMEKGNANMSLATMQQQIQSALPTPSVQVSEEFSFMGLGDDDEGDFSHVTV